MIEFESLKTVHRHTKPTPINIRHPDTGSFCGVTIFVLGPDSPAYRRAVTTFVSDRREGKISEESSSYMLSICAECVVGWEGIYSEGNPLEFKKEALVDLLSNSPSILDQVFSFIENRVNFT